MVYNEYNDKELDDNSNIFHKILDFPVYIVYTLYISNGA